MRSPLHSRIAALRGRVRRLLALHGLSLVVAGLAVFVLIAGLADWSIHLGPEIRVALLIGLIGLAAYLLARYVVAPLIVRFRDLDIALKIEKRWPGLNDRLASTVQFLDMEKAGEPDRSDILGSRSLREATIKQTLAETEAIDFREVVDPRPARKAMLVAAAALLVGASIFALDPRLGGLAMKRLFLPLASNPWPQMTHLAGLKYPAKVAKGEPFSLEVGVSQGERAPRSAKITYTYEDGEVVTESLRPDTRNMFHGRKETVEKSFTFRIAAGDDRTTEHKVAVVPPPVVTDSSVRLTFPAYTGMVPQRIAPGKMQIQAVWGTVVELEATANKPLASATLVRGEGQAPLATAVSTSKNNTLSARFELKESGPLTIALKDTEGFSSQEKDAVRYDLRSDKDEAPKVMIDDPANDRDVTPNADLPVEILADDDYGLGAVRLVYTISANGSEPSREVVLPLWAAETGTKEKPAAPSKRQAIRYLWKLEPLKLAPGSVIAFHADARDQDNLRGPNQGKSRELHLRVITHEQMAAQLTGQLGAIREDIDRALEMQKQALVPVRDAIRTLNRVDELDAARREDVKNAETIQRQLTGRITSKTDGLEQKIRRQLDEMKNLKIDNPDARRQLEDLMGGVETIRDNNLGPAEQGLTRASKDFEDKAGSQPRPEANDKTDDARNGEAEKNQGKQDAASEKSAASKGQEKSAAASKGQPKPDASKGDQTRSGESARGDQAKADQARGDQAKGDQSEADAAKADQARSGESAKGQEAGKAGEKADQGEQPESGKPSAGKDSLAMAEKNQKAIADELQRMRDSLGEFETYKGVVQDAKKLLKEHEDAMKAASEAASKANAGEPSDGKDNNAQNGNQPDAKQAADQDNAAARQEEVAKNLVNLENKMAEMSTKLDQAEPMSAAALRDAVEQSRKRGTSGKMEEAASGIKQNKMGEAQANQKQAQQDLKKLLDNLQNRRENELARLVKELKAAGEDMKKLRDKQAKNREQTGKAKQNPDAQAKKEELQKLSKEQKQIAEELKKQLLKLQKLRADAAAQAGSKAQSKMAQAGQEQEEGDADDAEKAQEEALAGLEEAQDEIEEARKDAEEQLAMEQLSKIKDNLQALADRQDQMAEETTEYDKARAARDLTRAQIVGVRTLGRVQEALKDEADELTERLDAAPAFALTLKKAGAGMTVAAQRLHDLKTDGDTLKAEQTASKRIRQLLDALKPDPPQNGAAGQQGGQGGQGGQQRRGGGDGIGLAAQLKVLKMMQQEINDRTETIDEIKTRKKALTPEQQTELDSLADDQRAIADIARDLTKPKKSDGEQ